MNVCQTMKEYEISKKQIKPNVNAYIYTKRIGDKTNQSKKNRKTQSKRRDQRLKQKNRSK